MTPDERLEAMTRALQAQGPDEFPTGYYRHLAQSLLDEEAER